ncbi:MAG: hypothetical protein ABIP17_09370 [Ilumatobacteraceae bacterium]
MVDVLVQRGTVAELHARDPFAGDGPDAPQVWWCRPTDDAIVLGSRQTADLVDRAACARAGLSVVRRRSGGGAVLMRRHDVHWIDVVVPTDVAPDDVRGSMVWIGERWRAVLDSLTDRELAVHKGPMVSTDWSDLVCFAGVGPGEVLCGGGKLVGLSQRRTRRGMRVQALIYGASVSHEYRDLFVGTVPDGDPGGQAWVAGLDGATLAGAIAERITPV